MSRTSRVFGLVCLVSLCLSTVCFAVGEDLEITGDIRWRLRHVDSAERGTITGTYGEFLSRGFSEKHRFVLEIAHPVAKNIRVGGMVRVSNEDEEVLQSGPDYLSSEVGSAFMEYKSPTLMSRVGYYHVSYTPLSLMRWDIEDDPEGGGGGCAVCGGPGGAGAILGETLEELGPDITFEGIRVEASQSETFGTSAFFARSTIADEAFPVLSFGGHVGIKKYVKRASSFLDVAAIAVRSQDDRKASDDEDDLDPGSIVFSNVVYGVTWHVPLTKELSLNGEWTLGRTESEDLGRPLGRKTETQGRGAIASLSAKVEGNLSVDASYIYLSPNWDSYFRALSYNPNRQGMRIRLEYGDDRLLVALFAKYLRTIDPASLKDGDPAETLVYPTLSARGYAEIMPNVNVGLAAVYSGEGTKNGGITLDVEKQRLTWLGTLTYEFGKDSSVTLEERYVENVSDVGPDYTVSMLSLYVRSAIW
jgi:hypothetical protein